MPVVRLTEITIRNLKPTEPGKAVIFTDSALRGFGVRVSGSTFTYTLTHGADRRRESLGRVGTIGLAEARAIAREKLAEATLGKHRPKRQTFEDALVQFVETRKVKNRAFTAYETERLLRVNFKALHKRQLDDIRAHDITAITDALSRRGKQSLAAHAHTAVHTFLRFCVQRQFLNANPIADLEKPRLPASRGRVLNDDELRAVWKAAEQTPGHFGIITRLLILTGSRRTEISSLRAEWVDLDKQLICLPSTHTKNKKSHTFPIGLLTSGLLSSLPCSAGHYFSARGSDGGRPFNGWSKAKAALDKKVEQILGRPCPHVIHDYRRTLATNWQRLGISTECIESYLNHVSGTRSGIVGVYQRHKFFDEQVRAVETYERWFQNS